MNAYRDLVCEMSKSELRELENRLAAIVEHLLKLNHVTGQIAIENNRGWNKSIRDQRLELVKHIDSNPGLKPRLLDSEVLNIAYGSALRTVRRQYQLIAFPRSCPFSIRDVVGAKVMSQL